MEYHFLQGKKNLLDGVDSANHLTTIKDKLESFFDMKNLCFLFGSGTSAKAIPLMKGLYEGLQTEKKSYTDEERSFLDNISDDENTLLSTKKSISFFEIVVKSVNSRDFSSQRI